MNARQGTTRPVSKRPAGVIKTRTAPPKDKTLLKFRDQLMGLVSAKTAYDPAVYRERQKISPLTGHCGPITYLAQKQFGGEIVSARVTFNWKGKRMQETHYWNRFGDKEADLTGSQYGGDGLHALDDPKSRGLGSGKTEPSLTFLTLGPRKVLPTRKTVNPRFQQFAKDWEKLNKFSR
jgi:hypothetical protein